MRLINTDTLRLESKHDPLEVEYAILSHTWGADDVEVTYDEWQMVHDPGVIMRSCPHVQNISAHDITAKSGYTKIIEACEQAKRDGIDYVWCDTNCIDKESSAELSEAINSMFGWYKNSHICYAYLADIRVPTGADNHACRSLDQGWFVRHGEAPDTEDVKKMFRESRWWTRGWTLQELLAPERVVFFDAGWTPLGHKTELADWIADFTTIHKRALESPATIPEFSIAQRMSWAAERTTSKPEDMAYCLLGIFDISMPMIYGQGSRAFMKLQEEIIKVSNDMSILAWEDITNGPPSGVLAPSPAFFLHSGDIVLAESFNQRPYSVTNFGLSIEIALLEVTPGGSSLAQLNCCRMIYSRHNHRDRLEAEHARVLPVWIPLQQTGSNKWLRSYTPLSQVYLEHNCEDAADIHTRNVFLPVSCPAIPDLSHPTPKPQAGSHSAGFSLTVGAGTMNLAGYFTKASPLPAFSSTVLSDRKFNGLSHHLVAYGSFTSIFSIAWKAGDVALARFTTINTTRLQFLGSRAGGGRTWQDVLGTGMTPNLDINDAATMLRGIHNCITTQFGEVTEEAFLMSPSIRVLAEPGQDLWGRPELIISYVFR